VEQQDGASGIEPARLVEPSGPGRQIRFMVKINQSRLAELCQKHDVRLLKLFGSAARGEDTTESDIDLLVEFEGQKSLFDLIGLEMELTEFLGRKVDLLTERSLSPYLRDRILASAAVIYERTG
jgi:uncharacterized protein